MDGAWLVERPSIEVNASSVTSLRRLGGPTIILPPSLGDVSDDGIMSATVGSRTRGAFGSTAFGVGREVCLCNWGNIKVTRPLGEVLKRVLVRSSVVAVEMDGTEDELVEAELLPIGWGDGRCSITMTRRSMAAPH